MPELELVVKAARPGIVLEIEPRSDAKTLMLNVQVRIDAPRRAYSPAEQARLVEVFGAPSMWSRTLNSLLWTSATVNARAGVPFELQLPVTFDFSLAAVKYFDAVSGNVPLLLLFSGTAFHGEPMKVAMINAEARFELPAAVWRQTLELQFPNQAALCVDRAVFERLRQFQLSKGLSSMQRALEELLP